MELWKDIKGYEGFYQASTFGNIRSIDRFVNSIHGTRISKGVILKPCVVAGYYQVLFCVGKARKHHKVHRLIAETFIPNLDNKPEVNHIDGLKLNNQIENIEWVTKSENSIHAVKIGLQKPLIGTVNPQSKLTEENVRFIWENKKIVPVKELATTFNVHQVTIQSIFRGDLWNSITGLTKPERDKTRRLIKKRPYTYNTRNEAHCKRY